MLRCPKITGLCICNGPLPSTKLDPKLKLGGICLPRGVNDDIQVWPDAQGRTSWLGWSLIT